MFTIKFSPALLHERHLQSPQVCARFMLFFLQEHVIDAHVFLNVILHLHQTTLNTKSGAAVNSVFIGFKHPSARLEPRSSGLRYCKCTRSA